jgi:hypothetical protein
VIDDCDDVQCGWRRELQAGAAAVTRLLNKRPNSVSSSAAAAAAGDDAAAAVDDAAAVGSEDHAASIGLKNVSVPLHAVELHLLQQHVNSTTSSSIASHIFASRHTFLVHALINAGDSITQDACSSLLRCVTCRAFAAIAPPPDVSPNSPMAFLLKVILSVPPPLLLLLLLLLLEANDDVTAGACPHAFQ